MENKKEVEKKLEHIAKSAIDKHLIKSWYYNGISFVVIFKQPEKLAPRKMSYKKWWKKYVRIQKKIAILNNKIRKLEGKI